MSLLGNSQRLYQTFGRNRQQTPPKTPIIVAKQVSSVHSGSCEALSAPKSYGSRGPRSSVSTPIAALVLELIGCTSATLAAFGVVPNGHADAVDLITIAPVLAFGLGVFMLVLSARQQMRGTMYDRSYLLMSLSTLAWSSSFFIVVVVFTAATPYQASAAAMWAGIVGSAVGYWGVTLNRRDQIVDVEVYHGCAGSNGGEYL